MKKHSLLYGKLLPALMTAAIAMAGHPASQILAEESNPQSQEQTSPDTSAETTEQKSSDAAETPDDAELTDLDSGTPDPAPSKVQAKEAGNEDTVTPLQQALLALVKESKPALTLTLPADVAMPETKNVTLGDGTILKAETVTPDNLGNISIQFSPVGTEAEAEEAIKNVSGESIDLIFKTNIETDTGSTDSCTVTYPLTAENGALKAGKPDVDTVPTNPEILTVDVNTTLSIRGANDGNENLPVLAPFNLKVQLNPNLKKVIDEINDLLSQQPTETTPLVGSKFDLKVEFDMPASLNLSQIIVEDDSEDTGEPEEGTEPNTDPHLKAGKPSISKNKLTVPIVAVDQDGKPIELKTIADLLKLQKALNEGIVLNLKAITPTSNADTQNKLKITTNTSGNLQAKINDPAFDLKADFTSTGQTSIDFTLADLTSVTKNYTVPMTLAIDGSGSENTDKNGVYQSPFGKMFSATAGVKSDDLTKLMNSMQKDLLAAAGLKEDEADFLRADVNKNLQLSYELDLPSGVLWNSKVAGISLNTDVFTVDSENVKAADGSITVPLKMNPQMTFKDVKGAVESMTGGLLITIPGLQVSAAAVPGETMSLKGTLSGSTAFLETASSAAAQTRASAPLKNVLFTASLQSNGATAKVAASGERKADDVDMPLSLLIDNALKEKEVKAGQNFALTTAVDLSKFGAAINDWLKTNAPKQANSENLDLNAMAKTPVLASDFDAVLEIKLPKGVKWDESAVNASLTNANFKIGDVDQAGQTVTLDLALTKSLANMNQLKELADNLTSYKTMNVTLSKLSADSSARTNTKLPITASLSGSFDSNVQNPVKPSDPLLDLQFDLDTETSNVVNVIVKPDDSGSSSSSSSSSSSTSSSKKVSGSSTKKQSSTSSTKKDSTKQSNVKTASATESQLFASLAAFAGFGIAAIAALKKKKD